MSRSHQKMPDAVFSLLSPTLESFYQNRIKRRPLKHSLRSIADGVYFIIRTGCQWKAAPAYYPPPSTLHRHFKQWASNGLLEQFWRKTIEIYHQKVGLRLHNQYMDGCITKAPYGGECTGRNPTDRGKSGTKRSVLVDANGVTLSVTFDGANVHDNRLLVETLEQALMFQNQNTERHIFFGQRL